MRGLQTSRAETTFGKWRRYTPRSSADDVLARRRSQGAAGVRVVRSPYQAPNANAYGERFVRSIKQECLDRMIPLGERHFRPAVSEFVAHYHRERDSPRFGAMR